MKFQPKRFVVEVKRGTSRAAFSSPDTSSDKFSNAEASLFGGSPKSDTSLPLQTKDKPPAGAAPRAEPRVFDGQPRRILESLIEEPVAAVVDDEPIERPRRGRKPGSKNKPKLAAPASAGSGAWPFLSPAARAFMEGPQPTVASSARHDPTIAEHRAEDSAVSRTSGDVSNGDGRQQQRPRLRERSSIIKRYVLGTEPKRGQIGSLRARRKARAAV